MRRASSRSPQRPRSSGARSASAGAPPGGPAGDGLKAVHQGFRHELALVRAEVARAAADAPGAGPSLVLQLRVNCLSLCQGLEFHHGSEDGGVFPWLEAQHPELAEPLARLRREHAVVADILGRLRALLALDDTRAGAQAEAQDRAAGPDEVLAEIDHLVSELAGDWVPSAAQSAELDRIAPARPPDGHPAAVFGRGSPA